MERTKKKSKDFFIGWDKAISEMPVKVVTPNTHLNSLENGKILACDPSVTAWGFAVMDWRGAVMEGGCVKTESLAKKLRIRKGDDTIRRISEITNVLLYLIKEYRVTYIVSELPHGSQSAAAAEMLGITKGIMQTLADTLNIGIEWYSEGDSKKALLGKISATKLETIQAVSKLYNIPKTGNKTKPTAPWSGVQYVDEAVADSVSVYHCAKKQSSLFKLMSHG